jgi:hypothetical protein
MPYTCLVCFGSINYDGEMQEIAFYPTTPPIALQATAVSETGGGLQPIMWYARHCMYLNLFSIAG